MAGVSITAVTLLAIVAPALGQLTLSSFLHSDGAQVVRQCSEAPVGIAKRCYDETSLEICYNGRGFGRVACEEPTTKCDPGNATCYQPKSEFSCPSAYGYYPSLKSCNEYYICTNGMPTLVTCPKGNFVYDPELKSCAAASATTPCRRFTCTPPKQGKTVAFPGDPRLFALCDTTSPVTLFECQRPGETYDEADQDCAVRCIREGNQAVDFVDCSMDYMECVSLGQGRFKATNRTCPQNSSFQPWGRFCTPGGCQPPALSRLEEIVAKLDSEKVGRLLERLPNGEKLKQIADKIRKGLRGGEHFTYYVPHEMDMSDEYPQYS